MLTGVMNRNKMNAYVEELSRGGKNVDSSVGVLFIDMNGLKRINDTQGHPAGDIMLKNVATVLRRAFDETEIFRAGGDEFAVIKLDISEEELTARMKEVKEYCKDYENLSFAIGGCVENECRNVRMALRIWFDKEVHRLWKRYRRMNKQIKNRKKELQL